jgi:hypothetical protein
MVLTDSQLSNFAVANPHLVTQKASVLYPDLFVVKYKNKVFYDNLWTPELREMRGLVVDKDWNVIVRPFTKVFNRFENGTDIALDERVTAVRKINGFLGCATFHYAHGLIVSTTGSLDSEFAAMARKWLVPYMDFFAQDESNTWMFEIVDENDPHIIKEFPGVYLIGARDIMYGDCLTEDHLDAIARRVQNQYDNEFAFMRPDWYITNFLEIVGMTKRCRHEGFMVYGKKTTLKIKSPFYLVKKLFSRVNPEKINDTWLDTAKSWIDEEYYPVVDMIRGDMANFKTLDPAQRREYLEEFIWTLV